METLESNRNWISLSRKAETEVEILDRNTRRLVAQVHGDDQHFRRERGRILAAAPELLEALEAIDAFERTSGRPYSMAAVRARAAISRAY